MGLGRADDTRPWTSVIASTTSIRRLARSIRQAVRATSLPQRRPGVRQDSDERVVRRAGLGQRVYLIMSEEALGRGRYAGEGYALGDVPDEPSVADGRCEAQRQDAWAYRTVAGASPSSVRLCTQLETSEWGIRDRGTSSQRVRIWRRSATS
jgi:hypothetical protein